MERLSSVMTPDCCAYLAAAQASAGLSEIPSMIGV